MIFASSPGDHFDLFLAVHSPDRVPNCGFVGTVPAAAIVKLSVIAGAVTVGGDDAERAVGERRD